MLGASLAALVAGCGDDPQPAPPAPAPVVTPATPPADPLHEVTIATAPVNAKVLLSEAELGTTPYLLKFKKPTTVTLRADGFEPTSVLVDVDSEPNVVITLTPLPGGTGAPLADAAATTDRAPRPRSTSAVEPTSAPPADAAKPRPTSTLPYPNVASAKSDYQAGRIDRDDYDQAVRKLKARRLDKLTALKADYQAGRIDRNEYQRRKRIIDNEYRGG